MWASDESASRTALAEASPTVSCWEHHGARCNLGNKVTLVIKTVLGSTLPNALPQPVPKMKSQHIHREGGGNVTGNDMLLFKSSRENIPAAKE